VRGGGRGGYSTGNGGGGGAGVGRCFCGGGGGGRVCVQEGAGLVQRFHVCTINLYIYIYTHTHTYIYIYKRGYERAARARESDLQKYIDIYVHLCSAVRRSFARTSGENRVHP